MRTRSGRAAAACWLVGAWLAGCEAAGERHEFQDEGRACLKIAPDGRLEAIVRFPTCLSSSCSRALATSCTLSVEDAHVVIASRGAFETTGETECTDDCGELSASCRSEAEVSPGSYELSHGAAKTMAELGTEQLCFNAPP